MNKVSLTGRLTRDPEVRYSNGDVTKGVARFTLAVNRRFKREGEPDADFINCVAFGRLAEFCEKYFRQGMKIEVSGRIQTGSYTNREGHKVYTTDIIVEEQDFCERKNNDANAKPEPQGHDMGDGWATIPDGIAEELPFL